MADSLSKSAQRVQHILNEHGYAFEVVELSNSTRTAQDAADAIGCTVPQIAKSIIFKGASSGAPILAITSGPNRVDTQKLSLLTGEDIQSADADFVRNRTGFAIGGVSPVGHTEPLQTFIDEDLLEFDEIWAAAGTPRAVFKLQPDILPELTEGKIADIRQ